MLASMSNFLNFIEEFHAASILNSSNKFIILHTLHTHLAEKRKVRRKNIC